MHKNKYGAVITKNENNLRNKGCSFTHSEHIQLANAFKAHDIHTPLQRYRLKYSQKLHGNYRRDPEGVDTKWFTDSLVAIGILKDDSFKEIPKGVEIRQPEIIPKTQEEMIIIEIEPI